MLDKTKPFGEVTGSSGVTFMQDGKFYMGNGCECDMDGKAMENPLTPSQIELEELTAKIAELKLQSGEAVADVASQTAIIDNATIALKLASELADKIALELTEANSGIEALEAAIEKELADVADPVDAPAVDAPAVDTPAVDTPDTPVVPAKRVVGKPAVKKPAVKKSPAEKVPESF